MQSNKEVETANQNSPGDGAVETEVQKPKESPLCKDEPISEAEFRLLYVQLSNSEGLNSDSMKQASSDLQRSIEASPDSKPVVKRGRGRPKGSTNKNPMQRTSKKQSKRTHIEFSKHSDYVLPDRLKKRVKPESDIIIDLTKRSVAPVTETGFDLKDKVDIRTWKLLDKKAIICTLCCKPGNFAVLGPLYGPYKILVDKSSNEAKDMRGQKTEKTLHMRLHSDCAIWTPGLCYVGSDLFGIGRALTDAAKKRCTVCNEIGATLPCKSSIPCEQIFHYVCARQLGCSFNQNDFTIRCKEHK